MDTTFLLPVSPHARTAIKPLQNAGSGFRSEAELQTSVESDDPLKSFRQMVNGNTPENVGAIRVGNWKLIDGHTGRGDWYVKCPMPLAKVGLCNA